MTSLLDGCTPWPAEFVDRYRAAAACLAAVERERVTVTFLEPGDARLRLDLLPSAQADVSSLRLAQIGGVGSLERAAAARVGPVLGCRLQQVFGTAEGVLALTRPADPDETVLGTRGRPLSPDVEIRVVDADGQDVPEGVSGELLARGPHLPRGYYRAPDRTARAFTPDGCLRTGTLVRRTPAGDLVVTGHLTDVRFAP
ncbi:AMP-binding protein [Streptomyces virginiae]|uniref:AMP-binding protein n=1 Tax=Streptomyces virginiae TaxID=1961 RepID=UPI0022589EE0|nr:AMP-binding protein [Streptomyces virginiae]MCX4717319.1 AMP-binding protein [Streptomyces virginiae]